MCLLSIDATIGRVHRRGENSPVGSLRHQKTQGREGFVTTTQHVLDGARQGCDIAVNDKDKLV